MPEVAQAPTIVKSGLSPRSKAEGGKILDKDSSLGDKSVCAQSMAEGGRVLDKDRQTYPLHYVSLAV